MECLLLCDRCMRTGVFDSSTVTTPADAWSPPVPKTAIDVSRLLVVWVLSTGPALFARSHQYTWSLLLFIGPLTFTVVELKRAGLLAQVQKPVLMTLAVLFPMGGILTLALADDFFIYPQPAATLGITVPAVDLSGFDDAFQIPVEELAFYFLGFASLLMLYVWADAVLLPHARPLHRALHVSLPEVLIAFGAGVALSAAGWALQRALNPGSEMPGYWMYLMLVPTPMLVAFGPSVAHRINWLALGLLCLALWGHSILWEVTLAIPQGWWGYQQAAMLGVRIDAWHQLPIEAVLVWLMTPLATVVSFEALRARLVELPRRNP